MTRSRTIGPAEEEFVTRHRVGHLATADRQGQPQITPVCFVLLDGCVYVALDHKPKSVDVRQLKRVRNIGENPRVSFLVDDYRDDWQKLAFVQIRGVAELREPDAVEHHEVIARLREKYPQYRSMALEDQPCIRIAPMSVNAWSWNGWAQSAADSKTTSRPTILTDDVKSD